MWKTIFFIKGDTQKAYLAHSAMQWLVFLNDSYCQNNSHIPLLKMLSHIKRLISVYALHPLSFFLYGLMLNVTCQCGLVSPNDTPPVSSFTSIKYAAMLPAIQTEANTKYNHFSVIGMFNYRLNSPQKC